MTIKTKAFAVNIMSTIENSGCFVPDSLRCNRMTLDAIKAYMNEVRNHHKIPLDSCLYRIDLNFQDMFQKKYLITSEPLPFSNRYSVGHEKSEGGLDIYITLKNGCKCTPKDCFKNIANGKCTDAFIRTIICEKLFKDKYIKQQEER